MFNLILYLLLSFIPAAGKADKIAEAAYSTDGRTLYAALHLSDAGLNEDIFQLALKGYHKLEAQGKITRSGLLTIADLSQSSKNKRLYVIDLLKKTLLFNTYVAHGRNTGDEFARHFSNVTGSLQSSLGFYVTRQVAQGSKVGFSLILEGVEKGFNDHAAQREIIMHGASYATQSFIQRTGRLGRSFGCPALPPDLIRPIAETIRGGSCLFVYCRNVEYLHRSGYLN